MRVKLRKLIPRLANHREANMRFAEVVNSFVSEGDMVWVQDYHCKSR